LQSPKKSRPQDSTPADFTRPYLKCKPDDRRMHPRLHCKGLAAVRYLESDDRLQGTLFDLSVKGCCIETSASLPEAEEPAVEVSLSVNGVQLRLGGVVRNIRRGRRAGIEFTQITSRKAEQITQLVRELAGRGLGLA
jgi:hypothetical protein